MQRHAILLSLKIIKECEKRWQKSINELIKKFPSIYQVCNGDINKLILLLRKTVYPCEYMDSWERFDETSLPHKKSFYSKFITDKTLLIKTTYMLKKRLKNLN